MAALISDYRTLARPRCACDILDSRASITRIYRAELT